MVIRSTFLFSHPNRDIKTDDPVIISYLAFNSKTKISSDSLCPTILILSHPTLQINIKKVKMRIVVCLNRFSLRSKTQETLKLMVNIWQLHKASWYRIQRTDLQHVHDERTNLRKLLGMSPSQNNVSNILFDPTLILHDRSTKQIPSSHPYCSVLTLSYNLIALGYRPI